MVMDLFNLFKASPKIIIRGFWRVFQCLAPHCRIKAKDIKNQCRVCYVCTDDILYEHVSKQMVHSKYFDFSKHESLLFSNKQARESFCIKNRPNHMSKLASRSLEDTRIFFPTLEFFGLICRSLLSWKRMRSNSFKKANIINAMLWASYRLLPLNESFLIKTL